MEGCNDGEPGCREVEHVVDQPPATVSGSISCGVPGSGGWCRGDGELSLSGSEPLSGYTILALEGTRNGEPFACSGAACGVPLLEGSNSFSFWAISSWGDTSLMGSASKSLDTQDPSLSGSASGTPGDNGWYVSNVTVEASASDASPGSGLASIDVRMDGGGWTSYSGPFTIGEGSHDVELRAVDGAGNSETQSLGVDVDTQSPIADLDASPSFCAGCGETLDITVVVQDGGSGIAAWSLTASGRTVASGGGSIGQTITWDGDGLGGGTHTLELEARDEAGNTSDASFDFGLIAPTPGPQEDTGSGANPVGSPTPVSSPTATRTPRATPTASTVNFGPSTSVGAGLPAAPPDDSAGDSISDLQSPISDGPSGSAAAVLPPSGVVFGGAALALAGVATAIALETSRRRKEEEAQVRAEMERKNAEAKAREAAQRAALAAARSEAEFNLILGQIWDQATGGHAPSNAWMLGAAAAAEAARRAAKVEGDEPPPPLPEWKEAILDPKLPPPPPAPLPPIDLAKWKQQDYAAEEAWERERAYATYREGERASVPIDSPSPAAIAAEGSWLSRAWKAIRSGQSLRDASRVTLNPLESGHVSVRVSPQIGVGEKIPFRQRYGLSGTRYNPATAQEAVAGSRVRSAVGRAGLVTALVGSVLGNLYDYTLGAKREVGLGKEFLVSSGIDFAISVGVGLVAAAAVVGSTTAFGVTLPVWGTVALVTAVGVGLGLAIDATGIPSYLKANVGDGLDAWPGIFRNAETAVNELGERSGETPPHVGGRRRN